MNIRAVNIRAVKSLAATVGIALAAGFVAIAPATSASAASEFTLIAQDFNLIQDGTFRFTVELPEDIVLAALPNATLVITAYRTVASRDAVADAVDGTLPRSIDSVDLPLADLPRPSANSVQGVVLLESATRTPEKLQLSLPGLYPVTLEVRDGNEVIADLITFVNRVPGTEDVSSNEAAGNDLRVAIAMHPTTPVRLNGLGEVVVDEAVIAELTHLADLLDVLLPTDVPATIGVPPAWLAALAANGQTELADRLAVGLARHELLSAPRLPLDASQAADAGAQALYTEWLRDGDDILAEVAAKPSVRTITFIDSPLDQGGAALHRDLGSRLLVVTGDLYDQLPNSLGAAADTSSLLTIELADGVRMDATVPDRHASQLLSAATDQPTRTAILLVADLLAARQELIDGDELPSRRGIALAMPDLSLPATALFGEVVRLLADTPGLSTTTLDEFAVRTQQLTKDGDLVIAVLPTTVPVSLATRLAPLTSLTDEANATASMLPPTDPRITGWNALLDLLPTNGLTDAQVTLITADLRQQFFALRSAVEIPSGYSFTLTGRRTPVRIKLHNTSDTPLTVRVRMTSSKLLFPDGDQTVTLPPQAFFDVEVPIEVRSNGRFPVTLEVFTPSVPGLLVAPPVTLTARVTAISGLANLITGACVLVVITWWARHVRQNRRRRAAQKASLNHPVRTVDENG